MAIVFHRVNTCDDLFVYTSKSKSKKVLYSLESFTVYYPKLQNDNSVECLKKRFTILDEGFLSFLYFKFLHFIN